MKEKGSLPKRGPVRKRIGGWSKYNSMKARTDGYLFDSKRELARYLELKLAVASGDISGLEVKPRFYFKCAERGDLVRTSERYPRGRRVYYEADFAYWAGVRGRVVEDVKGVDTEVSALKRALVRWLHGVDVVLVK